MTSLIQAYIREDKWKWDILRAIQHEMLVNAGISTIDPSLKIMIRGLDLQKHYGMTIHFEHVDDLYYGWDGHEWHSSDLLSLELKTAPKQVCHPLGVRSGREWTQASFEFKNLRITTSKIIADESEEHILLILSRKYIPILCVYDIQLARNDQLIKTFKFREAEFIATSRFYNEKMKHAKRLLKTSKDWEEFKEAWKNELLVPSVPQPLLAVNALSSNSNSSFDTISVREIPQSSQSAFPISNSSSPIIHVVSLDSPTRY